MMACWWCCWPQPVPACWTCPSMLTTGYLSCCWPQPVPACWRQAIFHVAGHNLSQHADKRLSFMLLATPCPSMLTKGYLSCCWPQPVPACWRQAIFHVAGHNLSQHADDRLSFMLLATTCPSMLTTGYLSGPSPWHSYFTLPIIRPLATFLLNVQQRWIGSLLKMF